MSLIPIRRRRSCGEQRNSDGAVWERIKRSKAVSIAFGASALLVMGGWLRAYFALRATTQPLIIHFNNYEGINQIGGMGDLLNTAIFGLVVVLVNFGIALALEERDRFLGKLIAAATAVFAILLFIGFSVIVSVN